MATEKQTLANQQNASKSTGPRTEAGKARSSRNAVKTGVYSKLLVLPDENSAEFDALVSDLFKEWEPMGPTETALVLRLGGLLWRQFRTYRAENGLYCMYRQCPEGVGGVATALAKDGVETQAFSRLFSMDRSIERSIGATIDRLQKLQKNRKDRHGLNATQPDPEPPTPAA